MTVKPSRDNTGEADLRIQCGVILVFRFASSVVMRAGKKVGVSYRVLVGQVPTVPVVELQVKVERG